MKWSGKENPDEHPQPQELPISLPLTPVSAADVSEEGALIIVDRGHSQSTMTA